MVSVFSVIIVFVHSMSLCGCPKSSSGTVLSLTWKSPYLERPFRYWDEAPVAPYTCKPLCILGFTRHQESSFDGYEINCMYIRVFGNLFPQYGLNVVTMTRIPLFIFVESGNKKKSCKFLIHPHPMVEIAADKLESSVEGVRTPTWFIKMYKEGFTQV